MRHEAELRSRFGSRYPEVGVAQSQVSEVRGAIDAEVYHILANMKNSYSMAVQRERAIRASLKAKDRKTWRFQCRCETCRVETQS